MKLGKAIQQAAIMGDYVEAGNIADFMRHRLGMTYSAMMRVVQKVGVNPNEWEELIMESERHS